MKAARQYEEFALKIKTSESGDSVVEIVYSPYADGEVAFEEPVKAAELEALLGSLWSNIERGVFKPVKIAGAAEVCEEFDKVGEVFYSTLCRGQVGEKFDRTLSFAESQGRGLRLRLIFNPEKELQRHLSALPWELLRDPERGESLGLRSRFSLVRHLNVDRLDRALPVEPPLRVLVALCSPLDGPGKLDIEAQAEELRKAWGEESEARYPVELRFLPHATLAQARAELSRETYHVFHFMGHGDFEEQAGGTLLFETDDRLKDPVPTDKLSTLLGQFRHLRLVVLNACRSAETHFARGLDPWAGVAPALVRAGVTAVVGMQFPIHVPAAAIFGRAFYGSLAMGRSIDEAVAEGRQAIHLDSEYGREWITPVLYMRLQDGQVFDIQPPRIDETKEPRLGVRTFLNRVHDMASEIPGEDLLKLEGRFEGRKLLEGKDWGRDLFLPLRDFLERKAANQRSLCLQLDAHYSIAFAAGYVLWVKTGIEISLYQRTHLGWSQWTTAQPKPLEGPLWSREEVSEVHGGGRDVALALSVSQDVLADVEKHLNAEPGLPSVGQLIDLALYPDPNSTGLRDGTHALQVAQDLSARIHAMKLGPESTLHLFIAGPYAMVFFLGQLAHGFGCRIRIWEFDFEGGREYFPGILLPMK